MNENKNESAASRCRAQGGITKPEIDGKSRAAATPGDAAKGDA